MLIHTQKVLVSAQHELKIKLPDDFPTGEAEIVVRSSTPPVTATRPSFDDWLTQLLRLLPPAPAIPLEALRRENPRKAEPGTGSAAWETGHDRGAVRWCRALSDIPGGSLDGYAHRA